MYSRIVVLLEEPANEAKIDPSVAIHFAFGLTVGLEQPRRGFFDFSLDTDASFKLYSSCCRTRLARQLSPEGYRVCMSCFSPTPYLADANDLWLSAGGVRLEIEKAHKREEVSNGRFKVADPNAIEEYLKSQEFIHNLMPWLQPYFPPLDLPIVAWEMSEELDALWRGWKAAKRLRGEKKKVALAEFIATHSR